MMISANGSSDLSSEMEADAFRRLFPLRFHERHLVESIRPDARPLGEARETTFALGAVALLMDQHLQRLVALCCFLSFDDGRIVVVSAENEGRKMEKEPVNLEKRKLTLKCIPFSLTCILRKNYILADLTAEGESVMETLVTVVLDLSYQLVSLYKPGGPAIAHKSAIQDCVALTRQRVNELHKILKEAISDMEVD